MQEKTNHHLEARPVGELMRKYAVPCVISLLVAALYNIVDQDFCRSPTHPIWVLPETPPTRWSIRSR